ncbi:hypothetical protein SPSIL_050180 [Sporomusa silvacetica DSM 10669]|uniref:Uncharacterized protein n=1 Tax=Sporomusa silvacetica DSM 10669 TaxID=1123289 RepID=A0ABZ3IT00_9FIRM|nr:hypothetical protein [Sporomusa silvacetica]OZC22024.1 hypothetical protein SPSIL_07760 [Sporomusa silvacetica DSM 10669]
MSTHYDGDEESVTYHRQGSDSGIEPLVYLRSFHDIRHSYVEISEEFRLFHNLYYDKKNDKYVLITDSGDEEDAIIVEGKSVKIRLKLLKQYLAIRQMHLAIYFEMMTYSEKSLEELGVNAGSKQNRTTNLCYDLIFRDAEELISTKGCKAFSRLIGKKLIGGMPREKCGIWPYEAEGEYVDFIIGVDDNGDNITHTSDPEVLATYFDSKGGAYHYLTPVFFSRDVLTKYYANPDKFTVEDGHLWCKGLWGLRMDNNHEKYIIVYLGDLGNELSIKEQRYWKSFNVPPEGYISEVNFRRSFLAEWTNPQQSDLVFKSTFEQLFGAWESCFGWPLFKSLSTEDEHNFKALRIPLTNDQAEFDQQVLSLAKVLIDSINEKQIEPFIEKDSNTKGISKFEKFLQVQSWTGYEEHIKFLRSLWDLRLGAGHRKGDPYKRGVHTLYWIKRNYPMHSMIF